MLNCLHVVRQPPVAICYSVLLTLSFMSDFSSTSIATPLQFEGGLRQGAHLLTGAVMGVVGLAIMSQDWKARAR